MYTVKPLLNVVHSVVAPWLTGVAKVLLSGSIDLVKVARLRRPCARFRAISREAIAAGEMAERMEGGFVVIGFGVSVGVSFVGRTEL
jgi:hypothetical protein